MLSSFIKSQKQIKRHVILLIGLGFSLYKWVDILGVVDEKWILLYIWKDTTLWVLSPWTRLVFMAYKLQGNCTDFLQRKESDSNFLSLLIGLIKNWLDWPL